LKNLPVTNKTPTRKLSNQKSTLDKKLKKSPSKPVAPKIVLKKVVAKNDENLMTKMFKIALIKKLKQ